MSRYYFHSPGLDPEMRSVQTTGSIEAFVSVNTVICITLHLLGMHETFTVLGLRVAHYSAFTFEIILQVIVRKRLRALLKCWPLRSGSETINVATGLGRNCVIRLIICHLIRLQGNILINNF